MVITTATRYFLAWYFNENKEFQIPAWDYLNTSDYMEIPHQFRS